VGQPERLEQRPVQGDHLAGGDGQREAHLTVEREQVGRDVVGGLRHRPSLPSDGLQLVH
jgi:hypothetical protein